MGTMNTAKKTRRHQYLPKTMTMEPEMLDWLDAEAERRGCSVSEFARRVFGCYRSHAAEIEQLCPELKERAA